VLHLQTDDTIAEFVGHSHTPLIIYPLPAVVHWQILLLSTKLIAVFTQANAHTTDVVFV